MSVSDLSSSAFMDPSHGGTTDAQRSEFLLVSTEGGVDFDTMYPHLLSHREIRSPSSVVWRGILHLIGASIPKSQPVKYSLIETECTSTSPYGTARFQPHSETLLLSYEVWTGRALG